MKSILVASVLIGLFAAGPVFSAEDGWELVTIIPKQEAARDSSLVAFLDSLETAIENRDSLFIYEHLHQYIKSSFGYVSDSPIESFKIVWKPYLSESDFWPNAMRSIRQGGGWTIWSGKNDICFQTPYRIDPRDYICPKRSANGTEYTIEFLLEDGGAYVEDTLRVFIRNPEKHFSYPEKQWPDPPSNDVLQKYGLDDEPMIKTYLPDQMRGYALCKDIKSPAGNGCQLYFFKEDGRWLIICCMGRFSNILGGE